MKKRRRLFRNLILTSASLLCISTTSQAASADTTWPQRLTVSPAGAELSAKPAESVLGRLTAVNRGTAPVTVEYSISPYGVKGLNYEPDFTQLPGKPRVDSWVKLEPASKAVLKPNELFDVHYTVQVPATTVPGSYYAVIFAEASLVNTQPGTFATKTRVGHILYITVLGNTTKSFEVTGSSFSNVAFTGQPLTARAIIKNNGGVHDIARYTTTIQDSFGKTVFSGKQEARVLPATAREVSLTWTPSGVGGVYTVKRSVTVFNQTKSLPPERIVIFDMRVLLFGGLIILLLGTLLARSIMHALRKR